MYMRGGLFMLSVPFAYGALRPVSPPVQLITTR